MSNMSKSLTLAKIRPAKGDQPSELKNNILYMDSIGSSKETDEYVVMHSSLYKAIFGKTLKSSGRFRKILPIVKVSYRDADGERKSIYRAFCAESINGLDSSYACLSHHSMRLLSADGDAKEGDSVTVSKGNRLLFFLFHPNRAVFSATWIGVIGIAVSFIGILLSFFDIKVCSLIKCLCNFFQSCCYCCNC